MNALYGLPVLCIVLHVCEEFAWPGGFLSWYRRYRPEFAASLTVRFVVIVNTLLILFGLWLAVFGPGSSRGVSAWITLAAALACNGIFHLRGTLLSRGYSPGVVTGTLLYLPLCVGGVWFFVRHGATPQLIVASFVIGALYQFWSASNHQRRGAVGLPRNPP